MTSEKKPSIYYDRGTIGSSDELDEYGVWVKSEPQDLSSASAETQEPVEPFVPAIEDLPDFDTGFAADEEFDSFSGDDFAADGSAREDTDSETGNPLPAADDDFDSALNGDLNMPDLELPMEENSGESSVSLEFDDLELPVEEPQEEDGFTEVSMGDFLGSPPDLEEPAPAAGAAAKVELKSAASVQDLSTQLLMKIADELSSIRSELSTLKKEFSAVRGESPAEEHGAAQNRGSGFFDDEDDEKIALTGDELDNILNTADFTEESGADVIESLNDDFSSPEMEEPGSSVPFPETGESPPDMLSDQEDLITEESVTPEDTNPEIPGSIDIDLNPEQNNLDELESPNSMEGDLNRDSDISFDTQFDVVMDEEPVEESPPAEPEFKIDEDFNLGEAEFEDEELQQIREDGAQPMTPAPEDTSYLEEDAPPPLQDQESQEEISLDEEGGISLDTGSLEDDQVDSDELMFDESSLDLSDAVIDEPDLSAEITENPLQEPLLDEISIDLDMEEDGGAAGGFSEEQVFPLEMAEEEEAAITVPAEESEEQVLPPEDTVDQVIPEGFIVEADDSQVPFEDDAEEEAFSETGDAVPAETETAEKEEAEEGEDIPTEAGDLPTDIRQELKTVLSYMDQLLESLPDEKIEEFAKSEYFDTYKRLFKELGLV
jgi:hypothetical protein